jgi:hypothetical protein
VPINIEPAVLPSTANLMLYGPPKTWKTAAALSAPGKLLLINADLPNAPRYALKQEQERAGNLDRIDVAQFAGLDDLADIGRMALQGPAGGYYTYVLDPMGEAYRVLLEERSQKAVRPSLPQYGDVGVYLERFVRGMCEAPVNFIVIAHDMPIKDEDTGSVERLPNTGTSNPALGRKVMGMVDVLGYTGMRAEEGKPPEAVAQLVSGGGRHGGDRFGTLLEPGTTWRSMNLAEWFRDAGIPAGDNPKQ